MNGIVPIVALGVKPGNIGEHMKLNTSKNPVWLLTTIEHRPGPLSTTLPLLLTLLPLLLLLLLDFLLTF